MERLRRRQVYLIDRGARVDYLGVQMHIYSPSMATAIANGADIIRVHDVREMVQVARMTDAIVR